MEKTPSGKPKTFEERYSGANFGLSNDGSKTVSIDTRFVNPAYKIDIPDYRDSEFEVKRTEYEAVNTGAAAWDDEEEISKDLLEENEQDGTVPEVETASEEPMVLTPEIRVDHEVVEPVQVKEKFLENQTSEKSEVIEIADQDAIASILAKLKAVNDNHPPAEVAPPRKLEVVGGTDVASKTEITTDQKFIKDFLNEKKTEFAEIDQKEFAGKNLNGKEIHRFEAAYEAASTNLRELEEALQSSEELPMFELRGMADEYEKNISDIHAVRELFKTDSEVLEKKCTDIEDEIKNLNTDLNLLSSEMVTWKADLLNRKNYRQAVSDVKTLIASVREGNEVFSKEKIEEKMQRVRELHEAIFEFEMKQNGLVGGDGEAVAPAEATEDPFIESDEPELPLENLPGATKEGLSRFKAIDKRNEYLVNEAELASVAENLMIRELRNKGMQKEWESGNYWGISRPLSEMRFDEFRNHKPQYRAWLTELQQRAGNFVPKEESSMNMRMDEYLNKLYIGIVKAQQAAEKTGNETTRAKLLGI